MTAPGIRWCSCGQRAGHATVCRIDPVGDEERVDPASEDLFARRRGERFEKRRVSFDAARRERRAGMTAFDLHRHAVSRLAKLSTVAAGSVEPSRGGGDRSGPPRQQELSDDPAWREHWTVIRSRLERVHEKLDEAERGGSHEAATLTGEEKDRRVLREGRGYSCDAVVDLLGRDIAGSTRTVWRKRKQTHDSGTVQHRLAGCAVNTIDGEPREDPAVIAARPGVRRVSIDP